MTIQFDIPVDQIKIYGAGKTWSANTWKVLRAKGYNIISRWIDIDGVLTNPDDIVPDEIHNNKSLLREIWQHGCYEDCFTCDLMHLITNPEDGEKLSGALVELGHVTAWQKPVYITGTSKSVEPVGHSDRAWKQQDLVFHWPELSDPEQAIKQVVNHYKNNFVNQWITRNRPALISRA